MSNREYGKKEYNVIVIGIDQSYARTGISISADGKLKKVKSIDLSKCENNTLKRWKLESYLQECIESCKHKADFIICIIERIRLVSKGFLNINFIKSIGSLNSIIVDKCLEYEIPVYSVDTRCWKSQVIGTSKPKQNKFLVPPEKWPTVEWVINQGFEKSIILPVSSRKKECLIKGDLRYVYDNDACDSAAISMFYFVGDRSKLKLER